MSTSLLAVTVAVVCLISVTLRVAAAQKCGGTITEEGVFQSPDPFDERFKREESMECIWSIEAPADQRLVLKISKYALNKAYTCSEQNDHIAVFDGLTTEKEKRLAILCTKGQDFVIPSSENTLTVKFKTNRFNEMTGFISKIVFTFSESDGCGDNINLNADHPYLLRSPRIRHYEEGEAFECVYNFVAAENYAIKISFSLFQKFTCKYNNLLEIRDGTVPDSLILGTFCGKKLPPVIVSSSNRLSVRMSSAEKSKFAAVVSVTSRKCNPIQYVYEEKREYKSSDYGELYRGIHCGIQFRSNSNYYPVRVTIKDLDIESGTEAGKCDKDKLILGTRSTENALGEEFISNYDRFNYLASTSKLMAMYDKYAYLPHQFELCGKKTAEFYFPGTFFFNLIMAPGDEYDDLPFKGFDIDVSYVTFCGRNYTEPYGRILSGPGGSLDDCYTLISAPEGYTISLYFLSFQPTVMYNIVYVEVFDGKSTDERKIMSTQDDNAITAYNIPKPIFSTSNYLLIKNKRARNSQTSFDANYIITNKGRGCGGYYYADQGVLTSPLYPETYREMKSCEWVIETPVSTLLHLIFDEFDLSGDCTSNYVELFGRDGKTLSRFCSEKPGNFKSNDNYVKIVYVTGLNNSSKGWHAMFRAGECLRCRRHR